jgi:Fe-S cluster biosynthesis and repair protein YggX
MSDTRICVRCRQSLQPIPQAPYPGDLGQEIQEKICLDCWAQWQQAEVMVINELRLNFMDPGANDILIRHMREFLCLDLESPDSE